MKHVIILAFLLLSVVYCNSANAQCSIQVRSAFGFVFNCDTVDGTCVPAVCDHCHDWGFTLHCSCCVTSIEFHSDSGHCFSVCGVIQHVTNASWFPSRADCSTSDLTLTPANSGDNWCDGETLMMQICLNSTANPIGITITAHTTNCGDIVKHF